MEVDGAQERPEWAMRAGEAGGPGGRGGAVHALAGAQEEASWDLEETEESSPVTKAASV